MEAPSAEKLKAIHDLVAGVIGFSAERGDQLVVETLPFESTLNPEPDSRASKPAPPPPAAWYDQALKNKFVLVGVGVGVAVLLTLLVVVFKLARRSRAWSPAGDGSAARPPRLGENLNTADREPVGRASRAASETGNGRAERAEASAGHQESGGADQAYRRTSQERLHRHGARLEVLDERSGKTISEASWRSSSSAQR